MKTVSLSTLLTLAVMIHRVETASGIPSITSLTLLRRKILLLFFKTKQCSMRLLAETFLSNLDKSSLRHRALFSHSTDIV
jgi:hypothetical protein